MFNKPPAQNLSRCYYDAEDGTFVDDSQHIDDVIADCAAAHGVDQTVLSAMYAGLFVYYKVFLLSYQKKLSYLR